MNDDPEPLEPQNRDYYADLGVGMYATEAEIRKAHRKLALQHHPDKGGDPMEFRQVSSHLFMCTMSSTNMRAKVQEAYEFLSNLDLVNAMMYQWSLPNIQGEWRDYQMRHAAWTNRQEVRKRRDQKRHWQRQERQGKVDEQLQKELEERQERMRRQRAAEEEREQQEHQAREEQERQERARQKWHAAQNREWERIRRDQEERARAADARLRYQQELDQKKKKQREEEETQQKAQEQARNKALEEEQAKMERQRLADERERVQAARARQRQEEAARDRLNQDEQHKGHHTEVRCRMSPSDLTMTREERLLERRINEYKRLDGSTSD
jgi:curved DNA-binding protein CbpA